MVTRSWLDCLHHLHNCPSSLPSLPYRLVMRSPNSRVACFGDWSGSHSRCFYRDSYGNNSQELHTGECDYLALERHAVVVYVFEIDTKARLQSGKLSCEDVGAAVNVLCLGYEPNLFIWVDIVVN